MDWPLLERDLRVDSSVADRRTQSRAPREAARNREVGDKRVDPNDGVRVMWLRKTKYLGATSEEARMSLPGDDIVASPVLQTTHALTIDAPPERIWPWLMQMGHGRAGFYSDSPWWDACVNFYYRLLSRERGERPVAYQGRNVERIVPEWQDLRVGDAILDGPPGTACYIVRQIELGRSLVLFTDTHLPHLLPKGLRAKISGELSAAYLLVGLGSDKTRVVRRMRMTCRPLAFQLIALPAVLIWGELVTAPKSLRGLKRRSEGASSPS